MPLHRSRSDVRLGVVRDRELAVEQLALDASGPRGNGSDSSGCSTVPWNNVVARPGRDVIGIAEY